VRQLIFEGQAGSPTFATLLQAIRTMRGIVHIEWSQSLSPRLDAALMNRVVVTPEGTRMLRMALRRQPARRPLIPVLAHELQHVIEVPASPDVDPERTFSRPGKRSGGVYETEQAVTIQKQVEKEMRRIGSR
jgi:hypothetical protein